MIFQPALVDGTSRRIAALEKSRLGPARIARRIVTTAIALGLVSASVFAATIQTKVGRVTANWSDSLIWTGGVVPGAADDAVVSTNLSAITYDSAASGNVRSISGLGLTLTLARDLAAQDLYLREGTIVDGGHNLTVRGTLSNSLDDSGVDGNGGIRTGLGGNFFLGNLTLGRTGLYTFYPGDMISGSYTTNRIRDTWPDITVTQDPAAYGNRLDKGLSFEGAAGQISLGRTSATDQAEITLKWDSGLTGAIDWTLRWKGDHVAELQRYYDNGQIKTPAGSVPAGKVFNRNDNIFFDSTTGYTYVGFKQAANTQAAPVVCNTSWGDVHINTPDGLTYNYQGTGDFLSLFSADQNIAVQARQEPSPGNSQVSVNTAVALNVNGDKVGFYVKPSPSLDLNGQPFSLPSGARDLPQGGRIVRSGSDSNPRYVVTWPNGFVFCAVLNGSSNLDYGVSKPPGLQTVFDGLVGNLDGKTTNDYHIRNGEVLPLGIDNAGLNRFADSWRLSNTDGSLFRTGSAAVTVSPSRALTAVDLPHLALAQQTCGARGITDTTLLNNCITDLGATGDVTFADSAQRVQTELASAPSPTKLVPGTSNELTTLHSLIGQWIFEGPGGSLRDRTGRWGGVQLKGATLSPEGLRLTRSGWARADGYTGPDIAEKTLIAWLKMDDLGNGLPAGGPLALDGINQDHFDAIVFGEGTANTWISGSFGWKRTNEIPRLDNPRTTQPNEILKIAITYKPTATGLVKISIYKNDVLAVSYDKGTLDKWVAGNVEVLFGPRHTMRQGTTILGFLNATILGAEIHNVALTSDQLKERGVARAALR